MRNFLILSMFTLLIGCAGYNFEYGSSLADFQDQKFKDYKAGKKWNSEEETRFKKNLWAKTACVLAPGNLPIRHYCLIDLFDGKANNKEKIRILRKNISFLELSILITLFSNAKYIIEDYDFPVFSPPRIDI